MKKNKKRRIIYFILCALLIEVFFIASMNNQVTLNASEASSVTDKLSGINISIQNVGTADVVVEDNIVKGALLDGKYYKVEINWKIASDKYYNSVKGGDYFEIDLDDYYLSFNDSLTESDLTYNSVVIGKWRVEDNTIKCTFSNDCEQFLEVEGYFEVFCYCIRQDRVDANVNIGGVPLTIPLNPSASGFPYADKPLVDWDYGLLSKLGNHDTDDTSVDWFIYGNYDNAQAIYTGQSAETLGNVVVKDILSDDLIVEDIRINTPINHPKDSNTLSDKSAFKLQITDQFTIVNEEDIVGGIPFTSQAEWEEYINTHPLTYGSSKDKKTALVNLGTLPDSLKMGNNADDFKSKISAEYIHFTDDELNALANIYNINGEYPVYAFQVYVKAKSSNANGIFSKEEYTNTAYLTCTGSSESAQSPSLKINYITGGIQGNKPKTATLTKTDADTSTPIAGANFKLQHYINSAWEDYSPENASIVQITNANGQVTYTELVPGTYRFVEVMAAEGYDISSVVYSENQFVISSDDTEGITITATNKKIPQEPSSTDVNAGNTFKIAAWGFVALISLIVLIISFIAFSKEKYE